MRFNVEKEFQTLAKNQQNIINDIKQLNADISIVRTSNGGGLTEEQLTEFNAKYDELIKRAEESQKDFSDLEISVEAEIKSITKRIDKIEKDLKKKK